MLATDLQGATKLDSSFRKGESGDQSIDRVLIAMRATETVLKFLGSIGRRSEAEMYWRLFRERPPESFALIAAEAAVLSDSFGSVIEQFQYLSELGLTPGLVLGLFRPDQSEALSEQVGRALAAAGLEARCHDASDEGLPAAMAEDMRTGKLPVVRFLPGGEHGGELGADCGRDFASRMGDVGSWARVLGTGKLVILRERGGLGPRARGRLELAPGHVLNSHAGGLSLINLRTDFDALIGRGLLSRTELDLLNHIRDLEQNRASVGPKLAVSIASPLNLLEELFTVKGAGTLIVPGTPIATASSYADLDRDRLTALFKASFDKTLHPSFYDRPPALIYFEPNYRGAVVLEQSPIAPYLTKFAVDRVAQGEGIGRDLWYAVCRDQPSFYWRARDGNRIGSWYTTMCDGMVRADGWVVFWRGAETRDIPALVEQALDWPEDFVTSPDIGSGGAA